MPDKFVCNRVPSHFEYHTSSPSENPNADGHPTLPTPAAEYLVEDNFHTSYVPLNKTDSSNSPFATAQEVGVVHAEYIPLTYHTLQQHNIKYKLQCSNKSMKGFPRQGYAYGPTLEGTVGHTSVLAAQAYTTIELPRQSGAPQQEYQQNNGTSYFHHANEYQDFHPYPTSIQQADLDLSTALPESNVELIPVMEELYQGLAPVDYILTGVGAQFYR